MVEKAGTSTRTDDRLSLQLLEIGKEDCKYYSPIDINFLNMKRIHTSNLEWYLFNATPKKMYLTNYDGSVIVTGKWFGQPPYVCNGPLDDKYSFYQIHFHWGPSALGGSDHTFAGQRLALEIHLLFYKNEYLCLVDALDKLDGILCIAFLAELQEQENEKLKPITDNLNKIKFSKSRIKLFQLPISNLIEPFRDDYYMYWGRVQEKFDILWLISRRTMPIGANQVDSFTYIRNGENDTLNNNYRPIQPLGPRLIYYVNPLGPEGGKLFTTPAEDSSKKKKGGKDKKAAKISSSKTNVERDKETEEKKTEDFL